MLSGEGERANGLWWRVRSWLKGSRLTKRWQGRVVEACVESSLLYDCHVRVWYKRDMKRLQSWIGRCYRYVWSNMNPFPQADGSEWHEYAGCEELFGGEEREVEDREKSVGEDWTCPC